MSELEGLLATSGPATRAAVLVALRELAADDSQRVSTAARVALARHTAADDEVDPEIAARAADATQRLVPAEHTPAPASPAPDRGRRPLRLGRRWTVLAVGAAACAAAIVAVAILTADDRRMPYDFDGNGRQDLVARVPLDKERQVLIATDARSDTPKLIVPGDADVEKGANFARSVASGDFDGDGRPQLAIATFSERVVMFNDSWQPSSPIMLGSGFGTQLLVLDWDQNGKDDLIIGSSVVPTSEDSELAVGRIHLGTDEGLNKKEFTSLNGDANTRGFGQRLRAGDVYGDDAPELIGADPHEDDDVGSLAWCRRGRGEPTCEPFNPVNEAAADGGSSLAVAKLVGNQYDDIVVGDGRDGEVWIWSGSANGPREPQPLIEESPRGQAAGLGQAVEAGDWDGDGDAEIFAAAPGAGSVHMASGPDGPLEKIEGIVTSGNDVNLALLATTSDDRLDLIVSDENGLQRLRHDEAPTRLPVWDERVGALGRSSGGCGVSVLRMPTCD